MQNVLEKLNKNKLKKLFLGYNLTDGLLFKIAIYVLLISIGFIYIYPMLYMLSNAMQSVTDIINPTISWIPSTWYPDNFINAFSALKYFETLGESLIVTLVPAVLQTAVTALIGYGLAKFEVPGKNVWFVIILLTFIIPQQVYTIPKYVMFDQLKVVLNNDTGLLGSPLAIILPALFGQGVNSAVFVLIYYQFFKMSPKAFDEAAEIDGAGELKIFFNINLPLAGGAILTTFLFSLVWYWNETYISSMFLPDPAGINDTITTLQLALGDFVGTITTPDGTIDTSGEGIRLAATLLIILPMLIVYLCLQRFFIEGVEKSGIAGE